MNIITHTDFDGICCAALFLKKFGFDINIKYVTVKEAYSLSNQGVSYDYTCDLPKVGNSVNIDHHKSNYDRLKESNRLSEKDVVDPNAASATDLVFEYLRFKNDSVAEEIKSLGHLADTARLPDEYHPLDIVLSMNSDNSDVLLRISTLLAKKGKLILSTQWLQEKYESIRDIYNGTIEKIDSFLENISNLPTILVIDTRYVIPSKLAKEIFRPFFNRNVFVIALIYSKSPQEPVRVSFRVTKKKQSFYDVSKVAKAFGGGGHRMAAACSPKPESIPDTLIQELKRIAKPTDSIKYIQF